MEQMTKRIIKANNLDASCVDEFGTEEYNLDECITNPQLVTDFRRELPHRNIGKVVFESSDHEWNLVKNEADWDFPKAEIADILRGDLSEGFIVYAHFKDDDGDDRYGEVSGLDLAEARKYFGEQGTPMENLV